ncbi:baseplate J/gp47 family protein [Paenibacillus polymyxa]|uniref:baseplate J/gp47 family protein n=1 Tax=Paenibacillus polymyxa TaxID=1406 RepID=UPI0025B67521|nr:baseplate J/gp47 family protein [Paenibacillus polymyxa]MDN4085978.1 baseplate J/gp47 family protein [Paenibacillus polymyxa]MDN4111880.1 baseplate J/gp47 family protein [Paenibacillus polymyxa]
MYEAQTFETILERMLARIPDSMDKREGSVIYDALAPAASELAQMYVELDTNISLIFPNAENEEYLDSAVAWSGITRKEATKAHWRGKFYDSQGVLMDVPIGSRYSIEDLNYVVLSKLGVGQFVVECETAGLIGNQFSGSLLPIDFINGLARAELVDLLVSGEDTENGAALFDRYQDKVTKPITSANKNQYVVWAREVSGVGDAKTFPLWNGPGTVKVVVLDNNKRAPSAAVVQATQKYIDPTQDGHGEGAAPIGPVVTVVGAGEVPINVSVRVQLARDATPEDVKEQLEPSIAKYLEALAFNETDTLVRITRIANFILDVPPVIDYFDLTINGLTGNIQVPLDSVAVLGTVDVHV